MQSIHFGPSAEARGYACEPNQNADSVLRLENAALDKGFDGDLRNASGLRLQDLSESSASRLPSCEDAPSNRA